LIQVDNLAKSFAGEQGEVRALRGVSFTVAKGELFTLLGPSGCGKTTTLRCIAGLEQPVSGKILIDDRVVFNAGDGTFVAPERRNIGMVFQSYAIWPHMTVFQNVAYPLIGDGARAQTAERVERILERLGLGTMAERLAPNLSGGQQQRVALARALVAQPKVLLLDEPLSNLDAKLREQMRFELKSLQESFDITTVYVTHDQEEAMALSDRIALMYEGALIEVATPADLYLHPAHRVTADFLGVANFIPTTVDETGSDAGIELLLDCALGRFIARRSPEWLPGSASELFFRPENVELSADSAAGGLNRGSGVVQRAAFLGDCVDIVLRCGEVAVRARTHPSRAPAVGQRVHFFVPANSCIVFPASGAVRAGSPSFERRASDAAKDRWDRLAGGESG
jgi:iron(III) transport system ATP-binding protein